MYLFVLLSLTTAGYAAQNSNHKLRPTRMSKIEDNVCMTEACLEAASSIKQAMDTSADPCTDFYQFACGNYPASLPEHISIYGKSDEVRENNLKRFKEILEEPHQDQDPAIYNKLKNLYESCANKDGSQQAGLQPLVKLFKKLGGWPVAKPDWNQRTSDNWTTVLFGLMDAGLGYEYIFGVQIYYNEFNTSYSPLKMDFPKFPLTLEAPANGMLYAQYNEHLRSIIKVALDLGATPKQASIDMQKVLRLERELFEAHQRSRSEKPPTILTSGTTIKTLEGPKIKLPITFSKEFSWRGVEEQNMKGFDLEVLNRNVPSVDWNLFFKKVVQSDSLQNLHLFSSHLNYISKAIQILDSASKRTVTNYLLLRAALEATADHSITKSPNREIVCVQEAILGLPLISGNIFSRKIFTSDAKKVAEEMVEYVRNAFQKRIQRADWMDETTKQIAIDKLINVQQMVAYPDEITDVQLLEKIHREVEVQNNTFLENALHIRRLKQKISMSRFPMPIKQSSRITFALTMHFVNGFYIPNSNTIAILGGRLQGVYFNVDRPQYLNFGATGETVGHELTHGFDNIGSYFDKDGIKKEWWTAETRRKFEEKSQCLVKQFNSVYVPEIDRWLNGTFTLGENIADNGGTRQAYEAYEAWMKTNDPEPVLPGLNFNVKQLFWLINANAECMKITPEELLNQIKIDTHSPGKFRINVGYQNFEEFSNDFGCPVGSPMNPAKKCQIW